MSSNNQKEDSLGSFHTLQKVFFKDSESFQTIRKVSGQSEKCSGIWESLHPTICSVEIYSYTFVENAAKRFYALLACML